MIEEAFAAIAESVDELRRKFYGVTTARVINPVDPLTLGRVQVQLPFIDAVDLSPWARVATPMAGITHGHYFLPNLGDEVLVAFEHGDIRAPYVIGSLWTAMAPPPMPSPLPQIRAIRTLAGNQIVMQEVPPTIAIQTAPTPPVAMPAPASPVGPYQSVMLGPAGIQLATPIVVDIAVGTTKVTVTPASVTVVVGTSTLTLSPAGVQIHGATVSIVADGPLLLRGAPVLINS